MLEVATVVPNKSKATFQRFLVVRTILGRPAFRPSTWYRLLRRNRLDQNACTAILVHPVLVVQPEAAELARG
jgi:hypothetical protein